METCYRQKDHNTVYTVCVHLVGLVNENKFLDFKLSLCFESCMYSFGYFPGVRLWFAYVSEHSICSIFIGWV